LKPLLVAIDRKGETVSTQRTINTMVNTSSGRHKEALIRRQGPRCSIVLPVLTDLPVLTSYLRQLSRLQLPTDCELIILNTPGLDAELVEIRTTLPRLKLLDAGTTPDPSCFFQEAAKAADGTFLLFIRRPLLFDPAVLDESINELEASDEKVSCSAKAGFILVESRFCNASEGFNAIIKTLENMQASISSENSLDAPLSAEINNLTFGSLALKALLLKYNFTTVLDIGRGSGLHTRIFRKHNKRVTAIDLNPAIEDAIVGDYNQYGFDAHDCVWCCHVLEHQLNVNAFLKKVHSDLKEGGILAVTVPPAKHHIVGGHVTIWNAGLLMYNLVLAGFDCSNVALKKYGYNISAILRKETIALPANLTYDNGDLEKLALFFPDFVQQGFDGDIDEYNWGGYT